MGLGKKPCYMKFVLVGLYKGSPTNAKIPHLHVHKPKTLVVETVLVIFVYWGIPCTTAVVILNSHSNEN